MVPNLADISQLPIAGEITHPGAELDSAATALSLGDQAKLQHALNTRSELRERASLAFTNDGQTKQKLISRREFDRKTGKRKWVHDLVPARLPVAERRTIASQLKTLFPSLNRATRRKAAFSGSWMVMV